MKYLMVTIIVLFASASNADECKGGSGYGFKCGKILPAWGYEFQQQQELRRLEYQQQEQYWINMSRQREQEERIRQLEQQIQFKEK